MTTTENDFYPIVLATRPPTVLTRKQVDDYFRNKGVEFLTYTHIPAVKPHEEAHVSAEHFAEAVAFSKRGLTVTKIKKAYKR
jgi:hypothetical protein